MHKTSTRWILPLNPTFLNIIICNLKTMSRDRTVFARNNLQNSRDHAQTTSILDLDRTGWSLPWNKLRSYRAPLKMNLHLLIVGRVSCLDPSALGSNLMAVPNDHVSSPLVVSSRSRSEYSLDRSPITDQVLLDHCPIVGWVSIKYPLIVYRAPSRSQSWSPSDSVPSILSTTIQSYHTIMGRISLTTIRLWIRYSRPPSDRVSRLSRKPPDHGSRITPTMARISHPDPPISDRDFPTKPNYHTNHHNTNPLETTNRKKL